MMFNSYLESVNMREIQYKLEPPSLRTGAGHGHFRGFNRERSKKDAWAKKHKRAKMKKASRKRNRG